MADPTRVRMSGPLAPCALDFHADLLAQGYCPSTVVNLARVMAHVSRWLSGHGLEPRQFTLRRIEQFLGARRRGDCRKPRHGLATVLGYLRRQRIIPEPPARAPTALDRLLVRFGDYLLRERGLAESTSAARQAIALRFLQRSLPRGLHPEQLTAAEVTRFTLDESRKWSVGFAKFVVTGLRSLLHFLFVAGLTPTALAAAVPAVAGWRLSSLPRGLEQKQVTQLLRSCDRRTAVGRRDYAVLVLLVRLGLRAGEVAAMELDDLDWRRGEVTVRGKGPRQERLPLPIDVGEALVAYVRRGRPSSGCRKLFLRCRAPYRGASAAAVKGVVRQACRRAQLVGIGAHCLRHTAATQMLRSGAPLSEIAQVLRHSSVATTAIYAKVDRAALRDVARRWPGGAA